MNIAHKALLGIISAAGIALAGFGFGAHYKDIQWSLKWEARNLSDSKAAREAEQAERAKEQAWQDKLAEVSQNANKQIEDVRKRERAAADSRVRNAVNDYANRISQETSPTDGGAPSGIEMLAGLLNGADELAERFAAEAEESRKRGLACEASYDAL